MNAVSIDACTFLVLQDVKTIALGVLYEQLKESGADPEEYVGHYLVPDVLIKSLALTLVANNKYQQSLSTMKTLWEGTFLLTNMTHSELDNVCLEVLEHRTGRQPLT